MTKGDFDIAELDNFTSKLGTQNEIVQIFDSLRDILFYIKDVNYRWVTCNTASLRFLNFMDRSDVIGAVEYDFFPKPIADAIRSDDEDVIVNNRKIINRTELIIDETGHLAWVSSTKIPMSNQSGKVIGLMGTTRLLSRMDELPDAYRPFHKVIEYIQENVSSTINIKELAMISSLSDSQFRKRFRRLFRMSPQEFILKTRLQLAAKLLSTTNSPLIQVALKSGYCDQSYFTKRFHGFFGVTPKEYRRVWQVRL